MTSDWEAVKARLECHINYWTSERAKVRLLDEPEIAADIRAALERISDLENARMDRDEWRDTARAEMAGRAAAEAKLARCVEEAEAQQKAWLKHHAGTNDDDRRVMLGVILRFLAAAKGE